MPYAIAVRNNPGRGYMLRPIVQHADISVLSYMQKMADITVLSNVQKMADVSV